MPNSYIFLLFVGPCHEYRRLADKNTFIIGMKKRDNGRFMKYQKTSKPQHFAIGCKPCYGTDFYSQMYRLLGYASRFFSPTWIVAAIF
jgi:hypothetical protein